MRQVLNFGHTIGHAIERCGGYSIYHGEGVAMGMAVMTRACVRQGKCPPECWTVLEELLDRYLAFEKEAREAVFAAFEKHFKADDAFQK